MAWNAATANEPEGQIIKGWHIGELVQAMYENTCDRAMPIFVNLGATIKRNETKTQLVERIPDTSSKLKRVIAYQIEHPDASKSEIMEACDVSEFTVRKARQEIKTVA